MNKIVKKKLSNIVRSSEFYVFIMIIILGVFIQIKSGQFFTSNNIVDLLRSMIVPSIYALCAFLSFISTGPDVSFPLIAALSSYLATEFVVKTGYDGPAVVVYFIGILIGAIIGAFNGFIIVKYKFNSLIVTLATSTICSGILLGAFEASRIELPSSMVRFGSEYLLIVKNSKTGLGSMLPMTFLIMVGLYIIAYFILNYTVIGRGVYAIGGDEVSAERAGFNVKMIRFGVFVINGGLAAIGGLCYTYHSQYYVPTDFPGGEMIVIAAVILGGTKMTGGIGTLRGCILGTLLINIITNSLILVGVPILWQKIFIGFIIIIGTAVSVLQIQGNKSIKMKKSKQMEVVS